MKKVPFSSCTREAHEEKRRKKFVGQRLGVTPKSWSTPKRWLLIWNFVTHFQVFLIVFDHAGQNTQQSMIYYVEQYKVQY